MSPYMYRMHVNVWFFVRFPLGRVTAVQTAVRADITMVRWLPTEPNRTRDSDLYVASKLSATNRVGLAIMARILCGEKREARSETRVDAPLTHRPTNMQ